MVVVLHNLLVVLRSPVGEHILVVVHHSLQVERRIEEHHTVLQDEQAEGNHAGREEVRCRTQAVEFLAVECPAVGILVGLARSLEEAELARSLGEFADKGMTWLLVCGKDIMYLEEKIPKNVQVIYLVALLYVAVGP